MAKSGILYYTSGQVAWSLP